MIRGTSYVDTRHIGDGYSGYQVTLRKNKKTGQNYLEIETNDPGVRVIKRKVERL